MEKVRELESSLGNLRVLRFIQLRRERESLRSLLSNLELELIGG